MNSLNDRFNRMNITSPTFVENNRRNGDILGVDRNQEKMQNVESNENSNNFNCNQERSRGRGRIQKGGRGRGRGRGGRGYGGRGNQGRSNNRGEPRRYSDSSVHLKEANRRPCSSSGASGKNTVSSPSHVHTLKLVAGLDSFEYAKSLRVACIVSDSMLPITLQKIGCHGSINDENANINGTKSYKVIIKESSDSTKSKCYAVVFESRYKLTRNQTSKLLEVFAKHQYCGFLEWLAGAKGWRYEECSNEKSVSWKRRFVIQLNTLQSVYTLFAKPEQKFYFAEEKKRMVWRKHTELTEIVSDIRVWIEIIKPFSDLTRRRLLRNSSFGPDSPVHWAHHHPQTGYPLTVVTKATMMELVEGIIQLFQQEFCHTDADPLGKRWRNHEKRRVSDWNEEALKVCPDWNEDILESLLNNCSLQG
mmetsp:Transcript_44425/g.93268  ORF Transcript_44425/g.93268 Transcript_44425/m.93268 type:complete len:419 (-) Transcript_44425:135-1391(-)|eukprot:CAMPEP_0183703912 /NCGR_PEP_ID=MMETSP0737-20130205/1460_1 /TAXON_ID=385413 /ORGANISM="Thalassiosira miniscula, Strain CCMP1093" /LENGTH=418 /DNA_ID=CAMNT_0025930715 /DNA_START=133 /DNA_END=1389 /DNA_ORIENTATION=-